MTARAVVVAVLVAVLAGCSGATPDEDVPAPAVEEPAAEAAPTPPPTPTPTAMTLEEAGAHYLALVEPGNALNHEAIAAFEAEDWAALREIAARQAAEARTFSEGLLAAEWPAEVQPAVDELFVTSADRVAFFSRLAALTTDEETQAFILTQTPPASSAAQQIRTILGLENVPVG